MKPGKEEFLTLTSRIKNFSNEIVGSTDINYKIDIDEKIDKVITDISARKNIVLFVKEATNNAVKYSKAKQLAIVLQLIENQVTIEISDDGVGFDTSIVKGNGLGNMQKRIEELKGQFSITSELNLGTKVKATIPIVL
jgi:signal transduction histidine kinase